MTRRAWAALATVYVVWGSTYLAIMVAIRTLPPFLMSSARYLVAGAVLYAFAVRRGAPRPALRHWRSAVVAGAALLLVGNGGVAWSEQRVDSGVAALLIATVPLHTPSVASLGALAYLVVVGSIVTYSAYLWLMRSAPTSIVSTY